MSQPDIDITGKTERVTTSTYVRVVLVEAVIIILLYVFGRLFS